MSAYVCVNVSHFHTIILLTIVTRGYQGVPGGTRGYLRGALAKKMIITNMLVNKGEIYKCKSFIVQPQG
jgi:hypothetical protein